METASWYDSNNNDDDDDDDNEDDDDDNNDGIDDKNNDDDDGDDDDDDDDDDDNNNYTPCFNEVEGGGGYTAFTLSVRPSVRLSVRLSGCGQNRVRSVSSTIQAGSYQPTSEGVSRVKIVWQVSKFEFLAISLKL